MYKKFFTKDDIPQAYSPSSAGTNIDNVLLSPQTSNNDTFVANDVTSEECMLSPITSIESYSYPKQDTAGSGVAPPEFQDTVEFENSFRLSSGRLQSLDELPVEILLRIIEYVYFDAGANSSTSINKILEQFSALNLVSKKFRYLSSKYMYKYGIFNRPHSFDKFLANLNKNETLGKFVQFIDFQTFTSVGLGRTGRMNQEIQMVTSNTILNCLTKTPNLIEFLASENIQDDMNVDVLNHLFNHLPNLQALDFCGASSKSFYEAFYALQIDHPLKLLFKVSFHDCSNLTSDVFEKILPSLVNLRRLDLTHTAITSTILLNHMPKTCNLTHLSLSRCSKLTTRDLINFLINHPSVNNNQLKWLNLSIDSNVVSPLNSNYLFFTLNHLNASFLEYLNLRGLPITEKLLGLINLRFPYLKTLSIGYSSVEFESIYEFLRKQQNLQHIDLTGCKLGKSHILSLMELRNLESIEFNSKILKDLTNNDGEFVRINPTNIWKFYDNNGRRSWIYRLDPNDLFYKQIIQYGKILNLNLTYYDLETGEKLVNNIAKPDFLKCVGKKINCSIGFKDLKDCKHKNYLNNYDLENVWPGEFCERGIYNYYSLNI